MKLEDIKPYDKNAKKHPDKQLKLIADSIKAFGWQQSIKLGDKDTIIIGHGRWLAYEKYRDELELKPAWVIDKDGKTISGEPEQRKLTEKEEIAYRLADNKLNESDWEMGLAIEDLKELTPELFEITGFDPDLLIEPDDKDDDVPDVPEEATAKLGEIYKLGNHRIMCGDSTKIEDVEKLMDGKKADLMLTDPPYNLNFDYNSYEDNKTLDDYETLLTDAIYSNETSNKIITTGKQNIKSAYRLAEITDIGIWYSKNKMSGGKISNLSLWEPIIFIGKFDRNTRPNDIFEYTNENQKDVGGHTCPKTVKLFSELLSYTGKEGLVYDPFIGSGSTLIACEKTNRICYGMELDPKYIDVIIQRWEEFTGKTAELTAE